LANAFLKRGEGHGPSTVPQCGTLFDTVHTVDDPKDYPRCENVRNLDAGESFISESPTSVDLEARDLRRERGIIPIVTIRAFALPMSRSGTTSLSYCATII
jgi:hypothetical protein